MRSLSVCAWCLTAVLLIAARGPAEDAPAVSSFDFEQAEPAACWRSTAHEAVLSIVHEADLVRNGAGALQLTWTALDGQLAFLELGPVALAGRPRSLSLSIRMSEASPLMYAVRESDGSEYQGYMYTPGGRWHDLAVDLDELMLSEVSEDENGRLDVGQISAIVVADISNLPGEAGKSLGIKQGEQRMWLDDVTISERLAPHRSRRGPEGEIIIDDFDLDPLRCLPIGGPNLELTTGPDGEDPSALRVGYDQQGYRWAGFVAAVGYLDLADCTQIGLRVKAECAAPLTVVLEERDGSKYAVRQRLDPEAGWHDLAVDFTQFKLDPATRDENDQLDLDQLRVVIPVVNTRMAQVGDGGSGAWLVSRIWCR